MLRWQAVRKTSSWWLCSLCLAALFCASVRADPPPAATAAQAYDSLIEQAVQAYEAGRYAEARNTFRRAHALYPTSRTLRGIGMCAFNLGDYTDAIYQLEHALVESRKPLSGDQRAQTRALIAKAGARVGRFRLRLTPPEAVLRVDGQPALVLEGDELLVEAGQHEIEARAPGFLPARSSVRVEGGDRTTLVLRLLRDDDPLAARPSPARVARESLVDTPPRQSSASAQPSSSHDRQDHQGWVRAVGYVSLGVGAAGLLGFAVSGALALADENKLQEQCPNELCSQVKKSGYQVIQCLQIS